MSENKLSCPLGHTCSSCRWWIRVRGVNQLTGHDEDIEDCAINISNILAIKVIQGSNSVGAAIESFRNEVTNQQGTFLGLMNSAINQHKLLE